jgi:hypothetical protein
VGAENRRGRQERRSPDPNAEYAGAERRQGPRRKADLRRPLWQQPLAVLTAAGLGVLAALYLDRVPGFEPDVPAVIEPVSPSEPPSSALIVDPEQLEAAQTMRDEAERLTPTTVTLDEQTHERWLPRIARIEAVRADPHTPELLRVELDATVEALARVGLL